MGEELSRILNTIIGFFSGSDSKWKPTLKPGDSYNNSVVVRKSNHKLYLYDQKGNQIWSCPVATGKVSGNKTKIGDCKTPVGKFYISQFESNRPKEIFGDNRFYRLRGTGFSGIGIHGDANRPRQIGTNASHGCVRMPNDSLTVFGNKIGTTNSSGKKVYILDEHDRYKSGGKLIPKYDFRRN